MVRRTVAFFLLAGFLAVPIAIPAQAPGLPKVRERTEADFADGLKQFAVPLGAFDHIQNLANHPPGGRAAHKYESTVGPHLYYRWGWLVAKRQDIARYDALARAASYHWSEFRELYTVTQHPNKRGLDADDAAFAAFVARRLKIREEWYYTVNGHHWAAERETSAPLIRRTIDQVVRRVGCTREQVERFLAWVDLLATDFIPGPYNALALLLLPLA